jgi:hypothetical protein
MVNRLRANALGIKLKDAMYLIDEVVESAAALKK